MLQAESATLVDGVHGAEFTKHARGLRQRQPPRGRCCQWRQTPASANRAGASTVAVIPTSGEAKSSTTRDSTAAARLASAKVSSNTSSAAAIPSLHDQSFSVPQRPIVYWSISCAQLISTASIAAVDPASSRYASIVAVMPL